MSKPVATAPREVRVKLPPEVAARFGERDEDASAELRELVIVDLVRTGEISSGYGAKVLGLPKVEFLKVMGKHKVSPFNDTEEGLAAEREAVEGYSKRSS